MDAALWSVPAARDVAQEVLGSCGRAMPTTCRLKTLTAARAGSGIALWFPGELLHR
ncbi:hypothetical protein KCP78_19400 [Salmonella enterica subsp. enterica]|nr:hypothetical protein KCP78_19400 [Salmonella enterica subsp. enterica]